MSKGRTRTVRTCSTSTNSFMTPPLPKPPRHLIDPRPERIDEIPVDAPASGYRLVHLEVCIGLTRKIRRVSRMTLNTIAARHVPFQTHLLAPEQRSWPAGHIGPEVAYLSGEDLTGPARCFCGHARDRDPSRQRPRPPQAERLHSPSRDAADEGPERGGLGHPLVRQFATCGERGPSRDECDPELGRLPTARLVQLDSTSSIHPGAIPIKVDRPG